MRNVSQHHFIQDSAVDAKKTLNLPAVGSVSRGVLPLHRNIYIDDRRFQDVVANGLRLSERTATAHIVVAVTANKALIDAALGPRSPR